MTQDQRPTDGIAGPGETMESVPWETLVTGGPRDDRKWLVAAAVIVAVGVGVSVVRSVTAPEPVPITAPVAIEHPPPDAPTGAPTTVAVTQPPVVVAGEADLMAIEPGSLERMAAGVAELAVHQYFSGETAGYWPGAALAPARPTFVEATRAIAIERTAAASFVVTVAVSMLDETAAQEYVRRPLFAVAIPIASDGGAMGPSDLPAPVSPTVFHPWAAPIGEPVPMPPGLTALPTGGDLGVISAEPVSVLLLEDGSIRAQYVVTDGSGTEWPVAIRADQPG